MSSGHFRPERSGASREGLWICVANPHRIPIPPPFFYPLGSSKLQEYRNSFVVTGMIALLLLFLVAAVTVAPPSAFADYENTSVNTIAQVQTDNTMRVTSQRTYVFDTQYSLVAIPISGTTDKSKLSVDSVRLIQMGSTGAVVRNWWNLDRSEFQPLWRGLLFETKGVTSDVRKAENDAKIALDEGRGASEFFTIPTGDAFSFDERRNMIYVFLTPTALNTVIEYNYTITNATRIFDDSAELYWDFISSSLPCKSEDVNVSIQLPVPVGATVVPGQTIRAWGHGPAGYVKVEIDGTVDFHVDKANVGNYAQAHVVFPGKWLPNISVLQKLKNKGLRQNDAIVEELNWKDTYSASVITKDLLYIFEILFCIWIILAALFIYYKRGRQNYAELPPVSDLLASIKACAPEVLTRLTRNNNWSGQDVCTSLVSLDERGIIKIDDKRTNVRFKITPSTKKKQCSDVDNLSMKLVFEVAGDGYQSVSLDEILYACNNRRIDVYKLLVQWQKCLDLEVSKAGIFDELSRVTAKRLGVVAAFISIIGLYQWQILHIDIPGCALLLTGLIIGAIAYNVPRLTPVGCALYDELSQDESDECQPAWFDQLQRALESTFKQV